MISERGMNICKDYIKHRREAASLYPVITKVFREFDGKCFNVRLERALQEAVKPDHHVYCAKRYMWIEVYTYIGHGNGQITLAQIAIDDLTDGKRIQAEKLIESAQQKREQHLEEANKMEQFLENIDTVKQRLDSVKRLYNKMVDDVPYVAQEMIGAKHIY